jgi:hypothetical protein
MCTAKGGTVFTGGMCLAYGWQYRGVKADGSVPAATPKGPVAADRLGFCYTAMRMTSALTYSVSTAGATNCPSWHNSSTGNTAEWPLGTDNVRYQTQESYDAGQGWSFASGQCVYAYGIN